VPLRAGSDIVFLGGLINYVLENGRSSASTSCTTRTRRAILRDDFRDTEDLDGLFSGWDPEKRKYDPSLAATRAKTRTPRPAARAAAGGGHARQGGA
jgi:formate dehydrogenase major subunit